MFKRDRKGNLLDAHGNRDRPSSAALAEAVSYTDLRRPAERPATSAERAAERAGKPVHLKDIHLERGMQCVDCHFKQDNHGNGKLYGEPRNAVEISARTATAPTASCLRQRSGAGELDAAHHGPGAPEAAARNLSR